MTFDRTLSTNYKFPMRSNPGMSPVFLQYWFYTLYKPILSPTCWAMCMNAFALSLSGSETTVGLPLSASSQMLACKGTSPRKSILCFSQALVTPEFAPNMWVLFWQCGQVKSDIFCTIPRIGVWIVLNMLMPLTASFKAMSCGVETMTAPPCDQ